MTGNHPKFDRQTVSHILGLVDGWIYVMGEAIDGVLLMQCNAIFVLQESETNANNPRLIKLYIFYHSHFTLMGKFVQTENEQWT